MAPRRFALRPIGAEERNRVCVEGDAPLLVGLGVLFPRRRVALRDAGPDRDDGPVQINPVPAQRAQFASPCAGSHGQPQEGPHHASLNAALRIAAACSGVGGSGSLRAPRGGSACSSGFTVIQRHRTARLSAPLRQ